ncbi:MAG: hypothetical protein ACI8RZ_005605 [Myxococcota bacterium]|jgi:hypothetical protein
MIGLMVGLAQAATFSVDTTLPPQWRLTAAESSERVPLFPTPAQADLPRGMYAYTAGLAAGRVALGLAPILAPEQSSALIGFPTAHDNATTRLMARLFGVRDIGLGAIAMAATHNPTMLRRAYLFNAATDIADATMIAIPLATDAGIDPAAWRSLGFALGGCSMWLAGAWWTTR